MAMNAEHQYTVIIVQESDRNLVALNGCTEVFQLANGTLGREYFGLKIAKGMPEFLDMASVPKRYSVIFVGNHESNWRLKEDQRAKFRARTSRAETTLYVGGAIFLGSELAQFSDAWLAVHPNFKLLLSEEACVKNFVDEPFWMDGRIWSATGSISGIRLSLELVRALVGETSANLIASYVGLEKPGPTFSSVDQLKWDRLSASDQLVSNCISLMKANLETPIPTEVMSKSFGTSSRALERRFQKALQDSPQSIYRKIRLAAARQLLFQSQEPLIQVGLACGFSSSTQFYRSYKRQYGVSPSQERLARFDTA